MDVFSMIVWIVGISGVTSVAMYWLKMQNSEGINPDMEEDFFRMRDEIDRLNGRVQRLENAGD